MADKTESEAAKTVKLSDILDDSLQLEVSEEQAWALLYSLVDCYKHCGHNSFRLENSEQVSLSQDGQVSVHLLDTSSGEYSFCR